jgi:MIP family channel proteins
MEGDYFRRATAEFVGTFALTFIGAGSVIYGNIIGVAFAHGLVIAVMVSSVGHISGGHFNPAITLGFVVTRRMGLALAIPYWIVQFGGATVAALVLKWVLPSAAVSGTHLGVPALQNGVNSGEGVVIEAILTFFLVWAVFATAADPRGAFKQIAGLAIGLTITFDILMGGGLTGAAMNPARAFGPELVDNYWPNWWIYYVGPFAGAVIAAVIYEVLYLRPPRPLPVGPPESGLEEPAPGEAALE